MSLGKLEQGATVTGWKWSTLDEFKSDRQIGDNHFNLPLKNSKTVHCMHPLVNTDADENVLFYFIGDNEQIREFLGDPITFIIDIVKFYEGDGL
jgi:hypothetical protein